MLVMTTRSVMRRHLAETGEKVEGSKLTLSGALEQQISNIVENIFLKVDTDGSGKLSLEEFKVGFAKHPDICAFFRQF
jgi:Ca2+-binding EF-hand superfamily protein